MRKLLLKLLLVLALFRLSIAFASSNIASEVLNYQKNCPEGDFKEISYVKELLEYMYRFDQDFRKLFIQNRDDQEIRSLLKIIDSFHILKMKQILNEHGWITISRFGAEYDQKAWLLVQHADDDSFFQAGVLFVLSCLVEKGETDKKNYAYLYDRVAAKFHQVGILQKYGTQVEIENSDIKLQPYEGSLDEVDKRRSEIGLEPLKDYLNNVKEIYKPSISY